MKQDGMCMWEGEGGLGKMLEPEEKQELSVKECRLGSTERSALPPSKSRAQRQLEDFTISTSSFGKKK